MRYEITIDGEPFGKERPRLGRGCIYTPPRTKAYENRVAKAWYETYGDKKAQGAIFMRISVKYPLNKTDSKAKKAKKLSGEIHPTVKPDLDNVIKIICDGLNGVAYDDDKQVVVISAIKRYAAIPQVTVVIKEQ